MNGKSSKKTSLKVKILRYIWISIIPLAVLVIYSTLVMYGYYHQYDKIVSNITEANEYNITFKENMDEMMYKIVIGSANWTNSEQKLEGEDPYKLIEEARTSFQNLYDTAADSTSRKYLKGTIKLLNILEERDQDITDNVQEGGHYDENMEMLTMNVNTLTSLIQQQIQLYISNEASRMEIIRQNVTEQVKYALVSVVALLLFILLMSFSASRKLSRDIVVPLQNMAAATERFAQGDFSVRIEEINTSKELLTLSKSFNSMVGEISELVEDIKIEQKSQRMMELRLMQAQINPHFLYNTLDTIIWLTEAGQKKDAVNMLTSLSNFFRTTLSKGRDFINVAEEESHIKSYLEIQQFRYHDILEYSIEIPDEMKDYQICKLTLQPIVENALYHGIKNKRGGGKITVGGRIEDNVMYFTVTDNGIGMTPDELERLKGLITGEVSDDEQHGFGMSNVEKRIKLYFGKEYGITVVSSKYQEGTTIQVSIPALLNAAQDSALQGSL